MFMHSYSPVWQEDLLQTRFWPGLPEALFPSLFCCSIRDFTHGAASPMLTVGFRLLMGHSDTQRLEVPFWPPKFWVLILVHER